MCGYLLDSNVDDPISPNEVGKLDCPDNAKALI